MPPDKKRSKRESEALRLFQEHIREAEPLVGAFARRCRGVLEAPELRTIAWAGLWDAARRWDGEGEFVAYAKVRMRGAILDGIRRSAPMSRRTFLNRETLPERIAGAIACGLLPKALPIDSDPDGPVEAVEFRTPEALLDAKRRFEELEAVLKMLPERDRTILRRRLGGARLKDIARREGISDPRASQLLDRATRRAERRRFVLYPGPSDG